jgi:hypothetical protein
MNGGGIFTLVGLLVAMPFAAIADWFKFIRGLPPGHQELTKACHGTGMLALLGSWFWLTGGIVDYVNAFVRDPGNPVMWIAPALVSWGLGWVLINARYAAQAIGRPHRVTLVWRSLLKLAVGGFAWSWTGAFDHPAPATDASLWPGFLSLALSVVAVWCLSTGAMKLLLMLWGGGRDEAYPLVAEDIAAHEFDWDDGGMP